MTTATLPAAVSARPAREPGLARLWIARLLAASLAANAAAMLFAPEAWYRAVPGAAGTGPFNHHFVADVGLAFLAAAAALFAGSLQPQRLAGFALPAAVFLAGHAILHLAGHGLHGVAALWLALPPPPRGVAAAALAGRLGEAMIRYGEAKLGVTLDYLREIAANAPASFRLLGRVSQLGQSLRPVHRHATHMAALGAAMHDDCGTCVQIHVNLARQDGIPEDVLRRAVMGEAGTLPPAVAAPFRFGEAVAANDPEMHDLREALEAEYGKRAVIEMAIAIGFARFYPTIKRALGHARSCAVLRFDFGGVRARA